MSTAPMGRILPVQGRAQPPRPHRNGIFTHTHPGSITEPPPAEYRVTARLVEALRLFGIRVLGPMVVGVHGATGFAARGLPCPWRPLSGVFL
ncbi:MAG: hypothetical protein GY802_07720 [Gammaproteobacteria bacterium]|nr:hypothetical protein [Gammaproteobacteria bacterium]